MIKAIIIDDEPNNVNSLLQLLQLFCQEVEVIGSAGNKTEGLALIHRLQPELVFLDIEMPYGNAFDLLNELKEIRFEIIFITAFDNYAIKAFKYAAQDYLLKPINIDELKLAVARAAQQIKLKLVNEKAVQLLANIDNKNPLLEKMAIAGLDGVRFVPTADIVRLEASKNYTEVHLKDGTHMLATKTLGSFEEILPETQFCRIHHSHVVNLNFVKRYLKGRGGFIELEDSTQLEVAVRKKEVFYEKFMSKK